MENPPKRTASARINPPRTPEQVAEFHPNKARKMAEAQRIKGEKAKHPLPGIPLDKNEIIRLIKIHKGNLSHIADCMGTTRHALRKRADDDNDINTALKDARERQIDELEECVFGRAVESNDTTLQLFILKTQGRHRGWEQDEAKNSAKDIATAAFDFILNKSKNPAEQTKSSKPSE